MDVYVLINLFKYSCNVCKVKLLLIITCMSGCVCTCSLVTITQSCVQKAVKTCRHEVQNDAINQLDDLVTQVIDICIDVSIFLFRFVLFVAIKVLYCSLIYINIIKLLFFKQTEM